MTITIKQRPRELTCKLPIKQQTIEALLGLAWRKEKKQRPDWLVKELSAYC